MAGKYKVNSHWDETNIDDKALPINNIEMNSAGPNNGTTNVAYQDDLAITIPDHIPPNQNSHKTSISKGDLISTEISENRYQRLINKIEQTLTSKWTQYKPQLKLILFAIIFILYNVYLGFAVLKSWSDECTWCERVKFLLLLTICAYAGLFYFLILKKLFKRCLKKKSVPLQAFSKKLFHRRYSGIVMFLLVLSAMFTFILVDAVGHPERLVSFGGVVALLLFGFIFSKHPRQVKIRHVTWGIGLQFVFALLILRWPTGRSIFTCLAEKISSFLAYTDFGSSFMFGYLADGRLNGGNVTTSGVISAGATLATNVTSLNVILPTQMKIFAFSILPVICFFSFCVSILYYYGIMQWMVIHIGWLLQITIGTTAAESMNAAANIFLGQSEAPLLIRPYLPLMTKSELHAIMTGGFATIAGAVMAAYINLGIDAGHLLSASVMSAPAALAFSKLFYPETEVSQTTARSIKIEKGKERNALEAATNGVMTSISLVAIIAANLIAFVAFIYFVDETVSWFGSLVDLELSLTLIMSKIFTPLAYLMGIEWTECGLVAELIGLKTIVNEFVAYDRLSQVKQKLSARSVAIATYALCGFSNLASIGIQLGGLGAMAPDRVKDLAQVAFRAMIAGSAACFLTACVAGSLMTEDNFLPSS